MTSSFLKDIIRTIRNSLGRFLSLVAIVTIGVAFFVGVTASAPVMANSVNEYDKETHLMDFTLYSNYGFDEDDIEAIRNNPYVEQAEGRYFVDVMASENQTTQLVRIHSFNLEQTINQFVLMEGRMPTNRHECLAERGNQLNSTFEVGDIVHVTRPDDDLEDYLQDDFYTVVGLIDTPLYLNEEKETSTLSNRYIQSYFYVLDEAFTVDTYLQVVATLKDGTDYNTFSQSYEDYADEAVTSLEELGTTQAEHRKDAVVEEAMEKYQDGLDEYNEGKEEYDSEIAKAEQDLRKAANELAEGRTDLAEAKQTLQDKREEVEAQLVSAANQIHDARNEIEKGRQQVAEGQAELEAQKQTYAPTLALIENGITQINNNLPSLQTAETGLDGIAIRDNTPTATAVGLLQTTYSQPTLAQAVQDTSTSLIAMGASGSTYGEVLTGSSSVVSSITSLLGAIPTLTPAVTSTADLLTRPEILADSAWVGLIGAWTDPSLTTLTTNLTQAASQAGMVNAGAAALKASNLVLSALPDPSIGPLVTSLSGMGYPLTMASSLEDLVTTLQQAIQDLTLQRATLMAQKQQILDGFAQAQKMLDDATEEIERGYAATINASVELDKARNEANEEFAKAEEEIAQAERDLAQGQTDYNEGLTTFEEEKADGAQELEDARADLLKAKQDIDDLESGEWTVLGRTKHYSTVTYKDTINQMKAIAAVFPVFFFLVAALVCLTTMTRMVDEQRGQIGIYRALGYENGTIAVKYLAYAGGATIVGGILGSILGLAIFPGVIYTAWGMMYINPKMQMMIPWDTLVLANVSFLGVMLLTTYFALRVELKEVPSQLLRPKPPKNGKKIFLEKIHWLWKRLSFTSKVTARNLIRYKKRFFMTVLGVAGCTALMITGFGIRDSITTLADIQFGVIYHYAGTVTFEDDQSVSEIQHLVQEIIQDEDVENAVLLADYSGKAYGNNNASEVVTTQVYQDNDAIAGLYDLRTRVRHNPITLEDDGVILSEKLATNMGVSVGDTLRIESENGLIKEVRVSAICEMYVYHYVFMSETYYQSIFGTSIKENTAGVVTKDIASTQELQKRLTAMEGVDSISFYEQILNNFDQMIMGLNLIVVVLITASGCLAFVVLTNLTNVNISERQREIATLKVLGFRRHEVNMYIYKENMILTFIGSLGGIILGIILHGYIMRMVEMDYVMFGRNINFVSFLLAIVMTLGFALFVNILMAQKLRRIQMVESLKSVE